MNSASSDTDTKSDALSRMLSNIRPHMVMLHAFSATCTMQQVQGVWFRVYGIRPHVIVLHASCGDSPLRGSHNTRDA